MLRDYQKNTIEEFYRWYEVGNDGNPCLVLPTGSGKSHIVAALIRDMMHKWPHVRVLMLTHVKELIEQNAEKMRLHWPGAPMGIFSAGMRRRELGEPITFAGIQSVRNKASQIGHIDLVIIDECHLVSHKNEGSYRTLIESLKQNNPSMRVVGLTATPYRLGHGYITDGDALFDDLIEPVTVSDLVDKGFLATLRSKVTEEKLSVAGVHKRGGEYIEKELQAAVDKDGLNAGVVDEVINRAEGRKAWLFFCTGVQHALHIRDILRERGVTAECITGDTPKAERESIINSYKDGQITALTNANVLTTGFDYPDIDLIAMLRPTESPGLYVQMAGRGMRLKGHTDHCLVLDFAGVVSRHGPITAINPPSKKGDGPGEPPVKVCDTCGELCALSVRICPTCGEEFPEPEKKKPALYADDIMGVDVVNTMNVKNWFWSVQTSKKHGIDMLVISYSESLDGDAVKEYLTILHEGFAGKKGIITLRLIADRAGISIDDCETLADVAKTMNEYGTPPHVLKYKREGKYYRVLGREWIV